MCNESHRPQSASQLKSHNPGSPKKSETQRGDTDKPGRRRWLKSTLTAGAVGLAAGTGFMSFSGVSFAATLTKEQRDALSPAEALAMLMQGNERFRSGKMQKHDYLSQKRASVAGQYPAAAILSCIDSRTPAEILLDMRIGESFNARVAGNICNDDVVGSLEFACAVAGAKVIMVMGHTACGAVKGAIDGVKLGKLTGLLEEIEPAVKATRYAGDRTGKNAEFVDLVAANNVRRAMKEIRDESDILSKMEKEGKLKIVGAMYHLDGGRVELLN